MRSCRRQQLAAVLLAAVVVSVVLFLRLATLPIMSVTPPPTAPPVDASSICFHVHGYTECPWFRRARCVANEFRQTRLDVNVQAEGMPQRDRFITISRR